MVGRISTASLHNNTLRYAGDITSEMAKLSNQITSKYKYQSFSEMSGKVERVSGFQEKMGKIDNYLSGNTTVSTRLNAVSTSLANIQKATGEFLSDLATYNPTTQNNFNIEDSAKSALNKVKDLLNVQVGGRYLFSGSRTNASPIGDINAALTTPGVADDNYYVGDDQKDAARISDGFELEYGVTANDPAIQQLISGIRTVIQGAQEPLDMAMVKKGQDLVNSAKTTLSTLAAKVNLDITTVTSINSQHTQLKVFWEESLAEDIAADPTTATTELQLNSTILQASFSAFAKISQLKLTDYLN